MDVRGWIGARAGAVRERLQAALLEALSPTRCAGCERRDVLICDACLARLALIDPKTSCLACGAPFGSLICTECAGAPRAGEVPPRVRDGPDRVLAMAVFADPLPRIIRAYKDGGERRLAPLIAQMLVDCAEHAEEVAPERYGGILTAVDAVTFVPVTARAWRRRGFDHMEDIARAFAAETGLPVVDALVKRGSADQRALGRTGRQASARGAYEVVADVGGERLLLLDDVITTGATIAAAASSLSASGATRVDALAAARVW